MMLGLTPELVGDIVAAVTSRKDLLSLALTCKYLSAIVIPRMFVTVSMSPVSPGWRRFQKEGRRTTMFRNLVGARHLEIQTLAWRMVPTARPGMYETANALLESILAVVRPDGLKSL